MVPVTPARVDTLVGAVNSRLELDRITFGLGQHIYPVPVDNGSIAGCGVVVRHVSSNGPEKVIEMGWEAVEDAESPVVNSGAYPSDTASVSIVMFCEMVSVGAKL